MDNVSSSRFPQRDNSWRSANGEAEFAHIDLAEQWRSEREAPSLVALAANGSLNTNATGAVAAAAAAAEVAMETDSLCLEGVISDHDEAFDSFQRSTGTQEPQQQQMETSTSRAYIESGFAGAPHPCLPPPVVSAFENVSPEQPLHTLPAVKAPSPAVSSSLSEAPGSIGAPTVSAIAGNPQLSRKQTHQLQLAEKKMQQLLRRRFIHLQQAELLGWIAWLRFVHRETLLKTHLLAAAALDAYLNFCCRKAAAAAARRSKSAAAASLQRKSIEIESSLNSQQQETQRQQQQLLQEPQQHHTAEPRYPADGAAVFAFMREYFEVEKLPNNHPFFLPLRRLGQQVTAATAAENRMRSARNVAEAATGAARQVHAATTAAAAAATRSARTAAEVAFQAKLIARQLHRPSSLHSDSSCSNNSSLHKTLSKRGAFISCAGEDSEARTGSNSRGCNTTSERDFSSSTSSSTAGLASHASTAANEAAKCAAVAPSNLQAAAAAAALAATTAAELQSCVYSNDNQKLYTQSSSVFSKFLGPPAVTSKTNLKKNQLLPFGGGALRFRVLRAIERRRGSPAVLAVIFVALSRILGVRARLIVSLPPLNTRAASAAKPSSSSSSSSFIEKSRMSCCLQELLRRRSPADSNAAVAAAASLAAAAENCFSSEPPKWLLQHMLQIGCSIPSTYLFHKETKLSSGGSIAVADADSQSSTTISTPAQFGSFSGRAVFEGDFEEECQQIAAAQRRELCRMQQPLQVWSEYFCRLQQRWIACIFFSSSCMHHDASDMLAGRMFASKGASTTTKAFVEWKKKRAVSRARVAAFLGVSDMFLQSTTEAADVFLCGVKDGCFCTEKSSGNCSSVSCKQKRLDGRCSSSGISRSTTDNKDKGSSNRVGGGGNSRLAFFTHKTGGNSCSCSSSSVAELGAADACQQRQESQTPVVANEAQQQKLQAADSSKLQSEHQREIGGLLLLTGKRRPRRGVESDTRHEAAADEKKRNADASAVAAFTGDALKSTARESPCQSSCFARTAAAGDSHSTTKMLLRQQQQQHHVQQHKQIHEEMENLEWAEDGQKGTVIKSDSSTRVAEGAVRMFTAGSDCRAVSDSATKCCSSKQQAQKKKKRMSLLMRRCFPFVVELPPLLFFFHSPCRLTVVTFSTCSAPAEPAAAATATAADSTRNLETARQAAADWVSAKSLDAREEEFHTHVENIPPQSSELVSACHSRDKTGRRRPINSAEEMGKNLAATALYSLGRGQVFSFSLATVSAFQTYRTTHASASSASAVAVAVLLVLLMLLRLLLTMDKTSVPTAILEYVRQTVAAVFSTAAKEKEAKHFQQKSGSEAATRSFSKRQEQRPQHKNQPEKQQHKRNTMFPFETEEERYKLAAEISVAWRKAAVSSSSARRANYDSNTKSRSCRGGRSDHNCSSSGASNRSRSQSAGRRGGSSRTVPICTSHSSTIECLARSCISNSSCCGSAAAAFDNNESTGHQQQRCRTESTPSGTNKQSSKLIPRQPTTAVSFRTSQSTERLGIDFLLAARQKKFAHCSFSKRLPARRGAAAPAADSFAEGAFQGPESFSLAATSPASNIADAVPHDIRCCGDVDGMTGREREPAERATAAAVHDYNSNSCNVGICGRTSSVTEQQHQRQNNNDDLPTEAEETSAAPSAVDPVSERAFVLAVDENESVTDVTFRYASSWRKVLEKRQSRLQHWWTLSTTQHLLAPLQRQQQRQQQLGKQDERKQEKHQIQQAVFSKKKQQQEQFRKRHVADTEEGGKEASGKKFCVAAVAPAESRNSSTEGQQWQQQKTSDSSSSSESSNENSSVESCGDEPQQRRNGNVTDDDFIFFEPSEKESETSKSDDEIGAETVERAARGEQEVKEKAEAAPTKTEEGLRNQRGERESVVELNKVSKKRGNIAVEAASSQNYATASEGREETEEEEEQRRHFLAEEKERRELLAREPLPTSRTGFKNHPKFVLLSDLRVNEYIKPGTTPTAFFNGELVFLRSLVETLRNANEWRRLRRQVKTGELPLRRVRRKRNVFSRQQQQAGARQAKWLNPLFHQEQHSEEQDYRLQHQYARQKQQQSEQQAQASRKEQQDQHGEKMEAETEDIVGLYAEAQTEPMPPLCVENGKLPINERGYVEVGKLGVVPIGATHISLKTFYCEGSSNAYGAATRRDDNSTVLQQQRTCLSAASLSSALAAAASACAVEWAPAVVGFTLEVPEHQQQQRKQHWQKQLPRRWKLERDGIVVLEKDERLVRSKWTEERCRRERLWQQQQQRRELREREEAAMRWRILCRAILYWRDRQRSESHEQRLFSGVDDAAEKFYQTQGSSTSSAKTLVAPTGGEEEAAAASDDEQEKVVEDRNIQHVIGGTAGGRGRAAAGNTSGENGDPDGEAAKPIAQRQERKTKKEADFCPATQAKQSRSCSRNRRRREFLTTNTECMAISAATSGPAGTASWNENGVSQSAVVQTLQAEAAATVTFRTASTEGGIERAQSLSKDVQCKLDHQGSANEKDTLINLPYRRIPSGTPGRIELAGLSGVAEGEVEEGNDGGGGRTCQQARGKGEFTQRFCEPAESEEEWEEI